MNESEGQTRREVKVLLIRCCWTGTASSVSPPRSPFRFPSVKYTSLPSLEVGFLKYTPMKTEAPFKINNNYSLSRGNLEEEEWEPFSQEINR